MIEYRKGDVLQDTTEERVVAHVVNNRGGFGRGFALYATRKYPIVKEKYKKWYEYGTKNPHTDFILGNIQPFRIDDSLVFVNMLCQNGYRNKVNPIPLSYHALTECLNKLNSIKPSYPIWMPKIGCGLAGGDWNLIEIMITNILKDRNVVIYEYD